MAKRSHAQQTKHDKRVEELARELEHGGWAVKADLHGRDRPDSIGQGKHVPDLVATKAGATRIIEVETPETIQTDKEQHEAFRRSATHRQKTTFTIEEA